MTPTVKNAAPNILASIKASTRVLLHCHISPDPDSVGSALATRFALLQLGKKVTVIAGDSPFPAAFNHFPGASHILPKNFFEVDLLGTVDGGPFDLFLILDSGSPDMISRKKPFIPDEAFPASLKTVVIDHHASNTKYARDYNLVDQTYPATCQILFDLFTEWGIDITPDIAADLFIGMFTDTGGFRYPMTTSETYAIATVLTKKYPAFPKLISDMENTRTKESIIFQGIAYSHIEEFCGGKVAIASVSNEDVVKHAFKNEDMSSHSISSLLKSVIGYDVGICLIEIEPHVVKASMRTRDENKYNLSAIATSLGGGGHKAAAGVLFTCSLDEAKKRIADAIITYVTMHV